MATQFSNLKEFLQSIKILHLAMWMGMTILALLFKFVLGVEDQSEGDFLFPSIGIFTAVSSVAIGHLIFNQKIEQIRQKEEALMDKLGGFRVAYILKLALLEGAALLCLILYFLNGNPLLFYTFLFVWLLFAFEHPNEKKIKAALRIR